MENDKGCEVYIQVHSVQSVEIDPKAVQEVVDHTCRRMFQGKLVPGSYKSANGKIASVEKESVTMDFKIAKGGVIHVEISATVMPSKKKLVCVIFQNPTLDSEAAKKGFDLIAGSLAENAGGDK